MAKNDTLTALRNSSVRSVISRSGDRYSNLHPARRGSRSATRHFSPGNSVLLMQAAGTPQSPSASTWSFISEISGETTTARPGLTKGRRLKAERLAAAGRKHDHRIAAGDDGLHGLRLQRAEGIVSPVLLQDAAQLIPGMQFVHGMRYSRLSAHRSTLGKRFANQRLKCRCTSRIGNSRHDQTRPKTKLDGKAQEPATSAADFFPRRNDSAGAEEGGRSLRSAVPSIEMPRRPYLAKVLPTRSWSWSERRREIKRICRGDRSLAQPVGCWMRRSRKRVSTATEVYVTNVVKHFKWEPRGKRRLHKKPSTGRWPLADRGWHAELDRH